MTMRRFKRFLRYYSTWVVVAFGAFAAGWEAMPHPLHERLLASHPWIAGWEPYIWFAAFLLTFYKARTVPQGIDEPR